MGKTARGGKEEEKKKKSVRQHCFHDDPGATTYDDNDNVCLDAWTRDSAWTP
jgi:hypothetical protein